MQNEIKRGSMILIKAGTDIRTTGPERNKIAKRDYVVTVFDVSAAPKVTVQDVLNDDRYGYRELAIQYGADISELEALRKANTMEYYTRLAPIGVEKVTWVGAGGYWHETELANVEYVGESI